MPTSMPGTRYRQRYSPRIGPRRRDIIPAGVVNKPFRINKKSTGDQLEKSGCIFQIFNIATIETTITYHCSST